VLIMKLLHLESHQQELDRDRLIQAALAQMDASRAVDHEAVLEWALSLDGDAPLPLPKPALRRRTQAP
jgi:hypothetical protein